MKRPVERKNGLLWRKHGGTVSVRLWACLIAVLVVAAPLRAQQEWVRVATPNFELYTTSGEKRARKTILYFETIRSFFLQLSTSKQGTQLPVRIIGFRSKKEFEPFRPNEFASAYYVPSRKRDYIVMSSLSSERHMTAVHEYVHLLVRHSKVEMPPWINEGLAMLYSTLEPIGKKAKIGAFLPGYRQTLLDNKWLDIATLTSVDHDSPHYNERKRAGVFYAESWALVHMLFLSERYPREEFPKLVGSLSVGKPAEATFQEVYGKSFEQVYKDLRAYMRQDRFFSGLVDIKLEKAAEELEVRAATALEAGLVQADLLSSVRGKREQAKQVYLDLAARHPDRWEVEEGLGYLARKDGNNDHALRHLGRAVEFGSTNPETHWAYGYALQNNGASNAEVIAALEGAVRLKPDYKEVRLQLGYRQMQEANYVQALRHFNSVGNLKKEEAFPMFHAASVAYFHIGKPEEARKSAKRAQEYAATPSERAQSQEVIDLVDSGARPGQVRVAEARAFVNEEVTGQAATPRIRRRSRDEPDAEASAADSVTSSVPTEPKPNPLWLKVEGTFEQMECLGGTARVHLIAQGQPMILAILDPSAVDIKGAEGASVDLVCGPQDPQPLAVEYERQEGLPAGVAGVVRTMEFQ